MSTAIHGGRKPSCRGISPARWMFSCFPMLCVLSAATEEALPLTSHLQSLTVFSSISYDLNPPGLPKQRNDTQLDWRWRLSTTSPVRLVAWDAFHYTCVSETGVVFTDRDGSSNSHRTRLQSIDGTAGFSLHVCGDQGAFVPRGRFVTMQVTGRITVADPATRTVLLPDIASGVRTVEGLTRPIAIAVEANGKVNVHWEGLINDCIAECTLLSASNKQFRESGHPYVDPVLKDTVTCQFWDEPFPKDPIIELMLNTNVRTIPASIGPVEVPLPADTPLAAQNGE